MKQETVSGGGISWASSRQITTPAPHYSFLQAGCPSCPNQQRRSTEGWVKIEKDAHKRKSVPVFLRHGVKWSLWTCLCSFYRACGDDSTTLSCVLLTSSSTWCWCTARYRWETGDTGEMWDTCEGWEIQVRDGKYRWDGRYRRYMWDWRYRLDGRYTWDGKCVYAANPVQ